MKRLQKRRRTKNPQTYLLYFIGEMEKLRKATPVEGPFFLMARGPVMRALDDLTSSLRELKADKPTIKAVQIFRERISGEFSRRHVSSIINRLKPLVQEQ